MTTFIVSIEVDRAVPATEAEAKEAARILARYLRNFTYKATIVDVKVKKEKK